MRIHINETYSSKNFNSRIFHLIMHYTAIDFNDSLKALLAGEVSAHYLISNIIANTNEADLVYRLVPDQERAWHAGLSKWGNRSNINDTSIGIELVNPGFTDDNGVRTWYPYGEQQILQCIALSQELVEKYHIAPHLVLGHSDISIGRKSDPGIYFPWKQFFEAGVGAWPDDATVDAYKKQFAVKKSYTIESITEKLLKYGYAFDPARDFTNAMIAFQMHFRPANHSGVPDDESAAILYALVDKYMPS